MLFSAWDAGRFSHALFSMGLRRFSHARFSMGLRVSSHALFSMGWRVFSNALFSRGLRVFSQTGHHGRMVKRLSENSVAYPDHKGTASNPLHGSFLEVFQNFPHC
jgi:hypothetical protein